MTAANVPETGLPGLWGRVARPSEDKATCRMRPCPLRTLRVCGTG